MVMTEWPGPLRSCTHGYHGAPMIYSLDLHEGCSWSLGWGTGAVTPGRQIRELRLCPADDNRPACTFRQVPILTFEPNLLVMPQAAFSRKDSTAARMLHILAAPGVGAASPVPRPCQTGDALLMPGHVCVFACNVWVHGNCLACHRGRPTKRL